MANTIKKILVLTILATTLTACGSGQTAETRMIKQVTDGVELSLKDNGVDIEILNLLLVATETGDAVLVGTIVNQGDVEDKLLGIAVGSNQAVLTGERVLKRINQFVLKAIPQTLKRSSTVFHLLQVAM